MKAHHLRKLSIAGLVTTVLTFTAPAAVHSVEQFSTDNGTVQVLPNIVTGLIAWIVAKTGWAAKEPPSIRFV